MVDFNNLQKSVEEMIEAAAVARNYGDDIAKTVAPYGDDSLYDLLNDIQDGEETDVEYIMHRLHEIVEEGGAK